jgi:hypothetical protein
VKQLQRTVTANINQINRQPHRMLQAAAAAAAQNAAVGAVNHINPAPPHIEPEQRVVAYHAAGGGGMDATLSPKPPDLYVLLDEWHIGIGGRKLARDFTERERGNKKTKSTFSRRHSFWKLANELIRCNRNSEEACNAIYDHYGRVKTVTAIIDCIIKDKGNFPGLADR